MKIPEKAFHRIRSSLWKSADDLNWPTLSSTQKSAIFEEWIRDEQVGGTLSRYLDSGSVRVYIKDTIMKPYAHERIRDFRPIAKFLGISDELSIAETYFKPHGRRLSDGKVICWGNSRDWKSVLFAVFERAYAVRSCTPFAAVIMFPTGKYQQTEYRKMMETASRNLGIYRLEWYDT